jgi:hypothetical protein
MKHKERREGRGEKRKEGGREREEKREKRGKVSTNIRREGRGEERRGKREGEREKRDSHPVFFSISQFIPCVCGGRENWDFGNLT